MFLCVLSSYIWLRRHAVPPEWDRKYNYCPAASSSRSRGTCQVRKPSEIYTSDVFFPTKHNLLKEHIMYPAHTRWWLKKKPWRRWRGRSGFRTVSPCPCLTVKPRPGGHHTTTQPSCHPAACQRPVPSLWATITLTTATGTALWIRARATSSTSKLWATSEGWVIVDSLPSVLQIGCRHLHSE